MKILTSQQYSELDTNSKLDALFQAIQSLPGNVSLGNIQKLNSPDKAHQREVVKQRLKAHFEQQFKRAYAIQ